METLILAGIVVVAAYVLMNQDKNAEEKKKGGKPLVSPRTLPECFSTFQDILTEYHKDNKWWNFREVNEKEGRMIAIMNFGELIGDDIGTAERYIVLTATFEPVEEGKTAIYMLFEGKSTWNRQTVDEIISDIRMRVRYRLGAS